MFKTYKPIKMDFTHTAFNPEVIMNSGQVFRMTKDDFGFYTACSGDKAITFRNPKGKEWLFYCSPEDWSSFWFQYFDLNTDYSIPNRKIQTGKDNFLKNALSFGYGMRILHQDLWETIITFIISQQNNIPKIQKTVNILCERYGHPEILQHDSVGSLRTYFTFPKAADFANLSLSELTDGTMLGYRAEYILKLSKDVQSHRFALNKIQSESYDDALKRLLEVKGIGPKVGNCVALYGLHHLNSYPIDTWMEKIIRQDYKDYTIKSYMDWLHRRYHGYEGYIQQLQFYYKRNWK